MSHDNNGNLLIKPLTKPLGHNLVSNNGPSVPRATKNVGGRNWRGKLPRPPNSFILYRQHHHPLMKAKNPSFHNNQICKSWHFLNASVLIWPALILGKQWRDESEEVKDRFKALAEELKKQHLRDHPDYQYQPRKPTEKKRRMTRRRAEALAMSGESSAITEVQAMDGEPSTASDDSALNGGPSTIAANDALAILQSINDGSNTDYAASVQPEPFDFELPELETTYNGNIILNLGDQGLDSDILEAMLESTNGSAAPAALIQGHRFPDLGTAALFNEPTQEAQDEYNFYAAINDPTLLQDFQDGRDDDDEPTAIHGHLAEQQQDIQQYANQYEETYSELVDKFTYVNQDIAKHGFGEFDLLDDELISF